MLTRSICCYCGVGCGLLIRTEQTESGGAHIVSVEGDPEHPANFGRLCTKGRSLHKTAQSSAGRALYPELRAQRSADGGGRSDGAGGCSGVDGADGNGDGRGSGSGERQRVTWEAALQAVADPLSDIIQRHGPDSVAFYLSGQLLTEDYYVFNKLAKGLIGTNNVDTNSRLCMSSAVTAYKKAFGADGPPTCYEDLEAAKTVVFAGSNMAYAHPVLFQRLQAAREKDPAVKWIVIDPRRTDTAAMADLHLAIQPGTDVALFNGMLHHLIWEGLIDSDYIARHTEDFTALKQMLREYTPKLVADLCGIAASDLMQAAEWFGHSPAALSLYCMGLNQSSHGTDKNLALINLHLATGQIGRAGAGPFSLTGQPNAMGGREVGGMATMLAAHREIDNAADRADLEQLWHLPAGALSPRRGLTAVDMFEAVREGRIKALWIVCTNPVHSMPNIEAVRRALGKAELVIVQDAFLNTDTTPYADVLLPAATWAEKDGTMTNSERRVARVRAAIDPPGEARPDWWIANEVARRIEARLRPEGERTLFPFNNPAEIFAEHTRLTAGRDLDMSALSYQRLDTDGPQQWPFPYSPPMDSECATRWPGLTARNDSQQPPHSTDSDGASKAPGTPARAQPQARRYTDGAFATANGRAKFHSTAYKPVADAISSRYPLRLITGRLRDQWHGMSRSGRVASAFAHVPEATLTMHPDDATRRGLTAGEIVRIANKRGAFHLTLAISDDVPSGSVFAPMHWSAQFLANGGANEVTTSAVDPYSFQPELKHAAVRVEKATFSWHLLAARYGDLLSLHAAAQPLLRECAFASISLYPDATNANASQAWLVIRAANDGAPAQWTDRLATALAVQAGPDVLEYRDASRGTLKRVAWRPATRHIDGLILSTAQQALNDPLLSVALSGLPWAGSRLSVFAKPSDTATPVSDTVLCNCLHVRQSKVLAALQGGANFNQIQARLGCGSVCGTCVPQLKRLCQSHAQSHAAP